MSFSQAERRLRELRDEMAGPVSLTETEELVAEYVEVLTTFGAAAARLLILSVSPMGSRRSVRPDFVWPHQVASRKIK
jgi:hypothetical protein